MSDIVQKLWGFCHVLRHDGIDYGDYIEQLTYLLFLKMANERGVELPKSCDWPTLYKKTGTDLTDHYIDVLRTLGKQTGLLGDIFAGAQSRFNNPVNLKRMITLIDETEWTALDVDVKAEAFEGLLEKAASEGKKGAGQYFTPRVLIKSIVRCMKPDPRAHKEFTIGDPACGTGGFLVAAYEWLIEQTGGALERDIAKRVRRSSYFGQDLVERPRRLALMNLYLHGLEPEIKLGDAIYEVPSGQRFDVVLTNPPFGTRGANQGPEREDFTIETSNKQLNFLQHVLTILKPGGRAAVVLPDNCLFESKAGEVIEILMQDCNLHTVLRLPRGTFTPYSQGVKANVIFFQKGYPTEAVWIFDARSNVPGITKNDRPLTAQHFAEFEAAYGNDPNGNSKRKDDGETGRFRRFYVSEVKERDYKLDITWLDDESVEDAEDLPEPQDLAVEAITTLEGVVNDLREIVVLIEKEENGRSLSELPPGWIEAPFMDVFDIQGGTQPPKSVFQYDPRGGCIRLLQIRDFGDKPLPTYIPYKNSLKLCKKDDVLIGRYGASVGRICTGMEGAYNVALAKVIIPEEFDKLFVFYLLKSEFFQRPILNLERSAQNGFNKEDLSEIYLPLAPLNEQRRIVAQLEKLLSRVSAVQARLGILPRSLRLFRQSILARAFRGELVPQNPNDEPASVMLERIRRERVADPHKKQRKIRSIKKGGKLRFGTKRAGLIRG